MTSGSGSKGVQRRRSTKVLCGFLTLLMLGVWGVAGTAPVSGAADPLPAPTNLAPHDTTAGPNPPLTWTAVPGAAYYKVSINSGPAQTTYASSFTSTTDLPVGVVAWSVTAYDKSNAPGLASSTSFTNAASAGPNLTCPAAIVNFPAQATSFSWSAVANIKTYTLDVSTTQGFAPGTVTSYKTQATSYTLTQGVPDSQTYYARVSGVSASGLGTPDSNTCTYQVVWSSGTTDINDATPVLRSPTNGASVRDVLLKWAPLKGAARYEIEISPNGDWTNNLLYDVVTDASTWAPGKTLNNSAYYWRVRGIDNQGNKSRWSDYPSASAGDAWTFTVVPNVAPTLLSPIGGAMVTNPDLNFSWVPVPGAGAYELQWDSDQNFSDFTNASFAQAHTCITTHTDWSPYTYETPPGTFTGPGGGSACTSNAVKQTGRTEMTQIYWRVRALDNYSKGELTDPWSTSPFTNTNTPPTNAAFNGLWSATGHFNFNNSPQTPTPLSPSSNASVSVPTMTWSQVPGTKYYLVTLTTTPGSWDSTSSSCKAGTSSSTDSFKTYGLSYTPSLVGTPRSTNLVSPNPQCPISVSWTVQSVDQGDRTSPAPLARSFTWSGFTGGGTTTGTITMTSAPSPGATVRGVPSFSWQPVGTVSGSGCAAGVNPQTVDHYQFWWFDSPSSSIYTVRRDWSRSPGSQDPITEAFTPTDLLPTGPGAWQIVALSAANCVLAASAKTALTIDMQPVQLTALITRNQDGSSNTCTTGQSVTCDVTSTPLIKWTTTPEATYYRVFIAQDPNFTNIVRTYDTAQNSIRPVEALPDNQAGQSYYLFVQPCATDWYSGNDATGTVCGKNDASIWLNGDVATQEWSFHKASPAITNLRVISPTSPTGGTSTNACDDASGVSTFSDMPTFCWNDDSTTPYASGDVGAMRYHIQVSTTADFTGIIDQAYVDQASYTPYVSSTSGSNNAGTGSYSPSSTASSPRDVTYPDGTYYWRVQAVDGTNNGLTYGVYNSGLPVTKTSAPVDLIGPSNTAQVSATPSLSWSTKTFAAKYQVQVARNGDTTFSQLAFSQYTDLSSITPSDNNSLTNGTALPAGTYAWRVRGIDADGNSDAWSAVRTFTVQPAAPTLVSPGDGNIFTNENGLGFSWGAVNGAVKYQLIIGSSNPPTSGTTVSQSTVATSWSINKTLTSGLWYWEVQAYDAQNKLMSTSSVRSFTYDSSRPTVASVTASAQDGGALLTWQASKAPAVPGGITSFTITATTSGQPTKTWTVHPTDTVNPPGTGGGGGNTVCNTASPLFCAYAITGLTNGVTYSIVITPNDANGPGTPSPAKSVKPLAYAPFTSPTNCVKRLYSDLEGITNPTAAQLNPYVNAINTQSWTCATVAGAMWQSGKFLDQFPIARLYQAYFLRIPDFGGLDYWIGLHRTKGYKTSFMSDFFVQSQEFKDTYGTLSNGDYVALVYENVLNRDGKTYDPDGYNYWLGLLNKKRINRGQLMLLFSESAEYVKVQMPTMKAELLVLEFLRRTPTQAEVNYYKALMTPVIDNPQPYDTKVQNQIKAIMATPEYQSRAN
jgi:hypothetical protein